MKALVTGASSGIGRDMAVYLSELGIDLILVARREDKLEELKNTLKTNVEIIPTDISDAENCIELHNQFHDVDILINNAGFGTFGKFNETSLIEEISMINTNICGMHTLTKLFLQDMKKRNSGYILNVASIAGFVPGPLMATYYATKSYVYRLSQSIYEELRKDKSNVKISVLCPAPTATEFMAKAGVKFKIKCASSEYVARYAIDKMFKGKLVILPGTQAKAVKIGSKIIPDKILARIVYRIQKKRK